MYLKDNQKHPRKVLTMFSTYDIEKFSKEIKKIRKSLGYSISDVSRNSGINESTIKSLEKGKTFPRFDTLHIISGFYKFDLIELFLSSLCEASVIDIMKRISLSSGSGDLKALNAELSLIQSNLDRDDIAPLQYKEYLQVKLYTKGLINAAKFLKGDKHAYLVALKYYEDSLVVGNSNFSFEKFKNFKYSAAEMNILFSAATILGIGRDCDFSNEILDFILDYFETIATNSIDCITLLSKIYYTFAYNYHRLDNHEKALEFSNLGIQHCLTSDSLACLPLLLGRKGVALKFLKENHWKEPIKTAISLLELQDNNDLIRIFNKFLCE